MKRLLPLVTLGTLLILTACADPSLVAQAVNATLTAAPQPTPVVVVVTVPGFNAGGIPTVTPAPEVQETLAAATQTLAATVGASAAVTQVGATQTSTATSTLTPTVSATLTPTAAANALSGVGQVIFDEQFDKPGVWDTSEDDSKRIVLAGGQLSITAKVADRFFIIYNATRRASDFVASLTGVNTLCHFRDRYGLLFRVRDSNNYYQFEVDCDGRYRLSKVAGGTLTPLQDWTASEAIQLGSSGLPNELTVRANGSRLEVSVNGQLLTSLEDKTYAEGGFGLYAGSGSQASYTAAFEQLRVFEINP